MTKMTAAPMPAAVLVLRDTPRKGHSPKNWLRTTLLTKEDPIKMTSSSFTFSIPIYLSSLSVFVAFCALFSS